MWAVTLRGSRLVPAIKEGLTLFLHVQFKEHQARAVIVLPRSGELYVTYYGVRWQSSHAQLSRA